MKFDFEREENAVGLMFTMFLAANAVCGRAMILSFSDFIDGDGCSEETRYFVVVCGKKYHRVIIIINSWNNNNNKTIHTVLLFLFTMSDSFIHFLPAVRVLNSSFEHHNISSVGMSFGLIRV